MFGREPWFLIHKRFIPLVPTRGRHIAKCRIMRRSKLEMYVDILQVLSHRGPLKLTHVMYKANVNCKVLKEYLDFLIAQNLIEERPVGKNRTVFAITQRGITVLKYFRELKQVLPIVEEARNSIPVPF